MKVIFCCVCLLLNACTSVYRLAANSDEATHLNKKLPDSPKVIKGRLSNGLTYIVRHNAEPAGYANMRLVVKAGAILEKDTQRGFAHLLEHMAFNGTEDFKQGDIARFIQSVGMTSGKDLNAYTSHDETVYKLKVPVDDPEILEKAILVLENWAHKIQLHPDSVNKERAVVIEEMRSRESSFSRLRGRRSFIEYQGSKYQRNVIGDKKSLTHGKFEELVQFYKTWYTPDRMAVIVVGDIDSEQIKETIEKHFSTIPASADKVTVGHTPIPSNALPLVSIDTEPGMRYTGIDIKVRHPLFVRSTHDEFRESIKHQLFLRMLNARIAEKATGESSAITRGFARFARVRGNMSAFTFNGSVKPGKPKQALKQMLNQIQGIKQYGFTMSEFDSEKKALVNNMKQSVAQSSSVTSKIYIGKYTNHFLRGQDLSDRAQLNAVFTRMLPSISLAEVNTLANQFYTDENRFIAVYGPPSEKNTFPSQSEVLSILSASESDELSPYEPVKTIASLIDVPVKKGSIVSKEYISELDAHKWRLSNGVTVMLKSTDYKKGRIRLLAQADGGRSIMDNDEYKQTMGMERFIQSVGVHTFSNAEIRKYKKGKSFWLRASVKNFHDEVFGSTSANDLEDFMQMLYLKMTSPKKNQKKFIQRKDVWISRFKAGRDNPNSVFSNQVNRALHKKTEREIEYSEDKYHALDLHVSMSMYRKHFANVSGFNFVFVGDMNLKKMESLVEQYVASMPSKPIDRTPRHYSPWAENLNNIVVKKGNVDKAKIEIRFIGNSVWSHEKNAEMALLVDTMRNKFRQRIREEMNASYSVKVKGWISKSLDHKYAVVISFSCDPNRVNQLKSEVFEMVNELQMKPVELSYVSNFIKNKLNERASLLSSNKFWLNYLVQYVGSKHPFQSLAEYEKMIQSLSVDTVQRSANQFLNTQSVLTAVLLPEPKQ